MRRTAVLLAGLALVVAGCGSAGKETPDAAPTDHADASAQSALLTKALTRFRAAGSGRYESEVTADDIGEPLAHETGSYRLKPVAAQYERTILGLDQASSKPRVQVTRVRSTADRHSFLQLKDWGTWTGCWLPMRAAALAKQTGVDLAWSGALPTAVDVLARARVVGAGDGMDGPHLAVDGYTALQFLGVSAPAISALRPSLTDATVPVLLDVTPTGAPSGAAVEGAQVADALHGAGITLPSSLAGYVAKAHARVVLHDLGSTVRVTAPGAAELLPLRARPSSNCPANR